MSLMRFYLKDITTFESKLKINNYKVQCKLDER